jgi:hypothetical protein
MEIVTSIKPGSDVKVVPVGSADEPRRWWDAVLVAYTSSGQYIVRSKHGARPELNMTQKVDKVAV